MTLDRDTLTEVEDWVRVAFFKDLMEGFLMSLSRAFLVFRSVRSDGLRFMKRRSNG